MSSIATTNESSSVTSLPTDLPPISHPLITGVSPLLTCTGKLRQNSLEISACVIRFVPD
jgi:hypothetical protein